MNNASIVALLYTTIIVQHIREVLVEIDDLSNKGNDVRYTHDEDYYNWYWK